MCAGQRRLIYFFDGGAPGSPFCSGCLSHMSHLSHEMDWPVSQNDTVVRANSVLLRFCLTSVSWLSHAVSDTKDFAGELLGRVNFFRCLGRSAQSGAWRGVGCGLFWLLFLLLPHARNVHYIWRGLGVKGANARRKHLYTRITNKWC